MGDVGGRIAVEKALSGGPVEIDVGVATGLCVPALRQAVGTCQLCGNDVVEEAEECDDGNTASGDGCSAVCRLEP